jgi:aminopeptidase N
MAAKVWRDHTGQEIPSKYVPKIDKDRERIVLKYANRAKKLNEQLSKLKDEMLEECDTFFENELIKNKVREFGKGNYSLTSFDKELKIEVNVQDRIEFDDQIQIAHAKIKEYLTEITEGVNSDIQQIVNAAFQTSKGKMDVKRILSLFELNITHKKWKEAMELIKASISRNNSKRYVKLWEKNTNGEYRSIELNFSSI